MNRPSRRPSILILALVVVSIVAACSPSGSLGQVPSPAPTAAPSVGQGEPDVTPAPTATPSSPAPGGSPSAGPSATPGETTIVRTYFYLDGEPGSAGLAALLREVPQTHAVGAAAIDALLAGPDPNDSGERLLSTAIPDGSRLLGLTIDDGIATVDLSSEFESGGGSLSMFTRLGQMVFTLTQFPTVESVLFEIEGQPVTVFSSEGIVLDGPVGRADYADLLPAIFVDRPAFGASIGNPARITGSANVFEATFMVTLLDAEGATLAETHTMATCGTGCRGTFELTLPYSVSEAGWGALLVWAASAKDGSPQWVREYPVWLEPAG